MGNILSDAGLGTGLYNNLQKYNLPDPQAVFDISFFHVNPEPFFALSKELFPEHLKNIDSLEFLTGIPEDKVVTAHGSHRTSTCTRCGKKFDLKWLEETFFGAVRVMMVADSWLNF
ncbi:unnamed protein product [Nippostrongylus brasiliensis]|uniref:NAD-dependent protein deacetylase sirtuin-2 (inferred by orthology to a human protein) n=1 Tax=Nippostrongylus brasiliensis TaxID=27835 RepID=A0A0N4YAZ6_NIPBR|nr:unnamed protein product [Nippostrongylus brasiliensis]